MKNRNIIVIGILLALALVLFFVARESGDEPISGRVVVKLDGQLYAEGRLGQTEDIVVTGENGEVNVISFTENGFFMRYSSCDNQLCVHEGTVTTENYPRRALGRSIICLPNRVTAELEIDDSSPVDMPDA